jgi:hypothetical protein
MTQIKKITLLRETVRWETRDVRYIGNPSFFRLLLFLLAVESLPAYFMSHPERNYTVDSAKFGLQNKASER